MIKILGVLDVIASFMLFLSPFNLAIPSGVILMFSIYLFLKGVLFIKNPASWIDLICAVLLVSAFYSLFALPKTLLFILGFILLQKGFFSLIAN